MSIRIIKRVALIGLLSLSTQVAAEINLNLNPAALDFGDVYIGYENSRDATIGITFNGSGSLDGQANNGNVTSVSIINASGPGFSTTTSCVGVAFSANNPTQTCGVVLRCNPAAEGVISAQLEVQFERLNGSAADIGTVSLSCNGVTGTPPTPPTPGPGAHAVPLLNSLGLGIISVLLGGAGLLGVSRRKK